ncbi:MAG: hypothetical protein IKS03_03735 [Ruminococcus sp.]|nr:hypothetical protein [Ruminococcus sp.]
MKAKPEVGWMHIDINVIKVCATCSYWNDPTEQHLAFSIAPNHVYYDASAREMCAKLKCPTYGNRPACSSYKANGRI